MEALDLKSIKLAQQGDEEAFSTIYHQFYNRIFYYALKLSKNEADAKDITQETFIQIHKSIKDLRKPEYFPLWVNRIVHSKFQRQLNRKHETAVEQEDLIHFIDVQDKVEETPSILTDADIFLDMINSLTSKQREVLYMMYYEQYTIKEIAEILQVPEGTAKSRIHQAKSALREKIIAFEKNEGRALSFRGDVVMPMLTVSIFMKLKDIFQHSSTTTQAALAISTVSTLVITTTAVTSTVHTFDAINKEPEASISSSTEKVSQPAFQTIQYESKTINNAKSAYYTLKAWAPDINQVKLKSTEEKQRIQSVLQNLRETNSVYYQQLVNSGWIDALQ